MTVIRDAIILVILILLALTVRISPRPEPVAIVPEARAESARAAAESDASSDRVQPSSEPDFEELLDVEDCARTPEAPAAGAAC